MTCTHPELSLEYNDPLPQRLLELLGLSLIALRDFSGVFGALGH